MNRESHEQFTAGGPPTCGCEPEWPAHNADLAERRQKPAVTTAENL